MKLKFAVIIKICIVTCIAFLDNGFERSFHQQSIRGLLPVFMSRFDKMQHLSRLYSGILWPFNISRVYWIDSGKVTLPEDDPDRNHAWEDCARNYHCSKRIIEGYLQKFGKDCNNDGVTNCYDYMMVNGNGGYGCTLLSTVR